MTDYVKETLLETILQRTALLMQGEEGATQPTGSLARRLAEQARAELADIDLFLRSATMPWEPAPSSVAISQLLHRALRVAAPFLLETATQVLDELPEPSPEISADGDLLTCLIARLLVDLSRISPEPGSLLLAIGWQGLPEDGPQSGDLAIRVESVGEPLTGKALLTKESRAIAQRAGIALAATGAAKGAAGPSTVVATLPRTPAAEPAAPEPDDSQEESAAPPAVLTASHASELTSRVKGLLAKARDEFLAANSTPRRVLVVDDDETVRAFFAAVLPTIGVEFELASDGEQALEAAREERFGLAILDKNLPDISGIDLIPQLREIQPHLEALMMSGYVSVFAFSQALQLGVSDFLEKPFPDLDIVLSRVDRGLRRGALHARIAGLTDRIDAAAGLLPKQPAEEYPELEQLQRSVGLSEPSTQPLRVVVLSGERAAADLSDPQAPFPQASVAVEVSARRLRARLEDPERRPDLLVLDPYVWGSGLNDLMALTESTPGGTVWVVVVTEDESLAEARHALATGVMDYILLRQAGPEALRTRIGEVIERLRLHRRDRAVVIDMFGIDIDLRVPLALPPQGHPGPEAGDFPALSERGER